MPVVTFRPWKRERLVAWMLAVVLSPLPGVAQGLLDEIQIHGLVSQGYIRSTGNNYLAASKDGSFEFNEAIVNFSTQVSENLRVGLQLLSRDLGKEGNNSVTLDWAYGDYRWRKNLGLRFGKLKSQIGLYNKERDVDLLRTSIILPQSVYEETAREFAQSYNGFCLYGNSLLPTVGRLNYELYAGTLPVSNPNSDFWQNNLGLLKDLLHLIFPLDTDFSIAIQSVTVKYATGGMLTWDTPLPGLSLSGNLIKGELDLSARIEALVPLEEALATDLPRTAANVNGVIRQPLDLTVEISRLSTLSAEYSWRDLQLAGEFLRAKYDIEAFGLPARMEWQGYYAMANYRLNDLLELGSYYSRFYPYEDDKDGERLASQGEPGFRAWKEDIALSTRFDVGENWLVKLEAHRMDGVAQVMVHDNPDGLTRNWHLFLAKISCHF